MLDDGSCGLILQGSISDGGTRTCDTGQLSGTPRAGYADALKCRGYFLSIPNFPHLVVRAHHTGLYPNAPGPSLGFPPHLTTFPLLQFQMARLGSGLGWVLGLGCVR